MTPGPAASDHKLEPGSWLVVVTEESWCLLDGSVSWSQLFTDLWSLSSASVKSEANT